jgi:predicted RNA binding protein YcfA (HicA-like mRNA interferase family)
MNGYPAAMNAKEVIKLLLADGWFEVKGKGSHRQFKHSAKPGKVTVPFHGTDEIGKGLLNSIKKQAGWK